ncbi:hypothetical protein AAFA70_000204 [Enterococcus faecalis]|uniref:hypothetical protein n=1 Tax=Enterococcus faecalis TaxID=1351 RepID=UPI001927CE7E|nr:hypothetical protein [Enterococcus faecalis]MCU2273562.1 hypothetical protein [Enterococcus faecalis]
MRGVLTMGTNEEHEKIDILDLELEKEFEDAEDYEQYRKIIRATMAQWLKNLKNGEIKLTSVSDLKTLIEADKILRS